MSSPSIRGLQEAQAANNRLIAAIQPNSGLGRGLLYLTTAVHRDAVATTHVITGSLRGSHRMAQESPLRYRIYIDPGAVNPRSNQYPSIYGMFEHGRGGSHAFYAIAAAHSPMYFEGAVNEIKREF